jgi:hypothetical protein
LDGNWKNSLFVVDGDGQGPWKYAGQNFLQLKVYCIENFGINLEVIATVFNLNREQVQDKLAEILKARKNNLFERSKSLAFLIDLLKPEDLTQDRLDQIDASDFFLLFLEFVGVQDRTEFWRSVFARCKDGTLAWEKVVPKEIDTFIEAIRRTSGAAG